MGKRLFAFAATTALVFHAGSALADEEAGWFTQPAPPPPVPAPVVTPASPPSETPASIEIAPPPATPAVTPVVTPVKTEKPKATEWYGWQTLLVDVAAVTAMVASVAESGDFAHGTGALLLPARLLGDEAPRSTGAIDASIALYTLGPGLVHALHGRAPEAVASPAIRALSPTIGTMTGAVYGFVVGACVAVATDGQGKVDPFIYGGMASGYVLGFAAPMLVDAAMFGHEPVDRASRPMEKKVDAAKVTWSPRVAWSKETRSPTVGLSGTF